MGVTKDVNVCECGWLKPRQLNVDVKLASPGEVVDLRIRYECPVCKCELGTGNPAVVESGKPDKFLHPVPERN